MTAFMKNPIQHGASNGSNYSTLSTTPCFSLLGHLGVISVSGNDAQVYLQSLLSNDIKLLNINESQYSSLCTPKGRLLALFLIIRTDKNTYQLILPDGLCEAIKTRLTMYILRSKVTVANTSENMICIGLTQDKPSLPINTSYHTLPSIFHRGIAITTTTEVDALCNSLIQQHYQPMPQAYWEWLDITSGIAKIELETQEKFTPQQLNLDITEAVNFQKGCYPGQEVVARLHYLGKASRRLFTAKASTSVLPETGSEILTTEGQMAGHIVSAQQQGQDGLVCLVSIKLACYDSSLLIDQTPITLTSGLVD
jgi:folate-binding protein YgfZ